MSSWIAVFLGGGLGSLARYGLSRWIGAPASGFPWATFGANVLACLVLGGAFYYFRQRGNDLPFSQLLILTGFCGGFSTFSTFSLETLHLLQAGQTLMAMIYVSVSIFCCLMLLWGLSQLLT